MQKTKSRTKERDSPHLFPPHFLACLVTMLRGGVTGRLPLGFFFSAGFKIYMKKDENDYREITAVKLPES